jgi:hypothetical protein
VTLTKNGTGDLTITFNVPFRRVPAVVAVGVGGYVSLQAEPTVSAVRLLLKTDAGVAADGIVHVHVAGFDSADQY